MEPKDEAILVTETQLKVAKHERKRWKDRVAQLEDRLRNIQETRNGEVYR